MKIQSLLLSILLILYGIGYLHAKSMMPQVRLITVNPFIPELMLEATRESPPLSIHSHGIEQGSYYVISKGKDGQPIVSQGGSFATPLYSASTDMVGQPAREPAPFMPRADSEFARFEEYLPERDVFIGGEYLTDKVERPIPNNPIFDAHVNNPYQNVYMPTAPPAPTQTPNLGPQTDPNILYHPAIPPRATKPERQPTPGFIPPRPAPHHHVPSTAQDYVHHSLNPVPAVPVLPTQTSTDIKQHLQDHNTQTINFYNRLHELVSSTLGVILLAFFGLIALFTIVGIVVGMWKCIFAKRFRNAKRPDEPLTRNLIVDDINNVSHDDNNPYAFQYQTM